MNINSKDYLENQNFGNAILTTSTDRFFDSIRRWGFKNSIWPILFSVGGNTFELKAYLESEKTISQIPMKGFHLSPSHSDLLIVCGAVTSKIAPILKKTYHQMKNPKWVLAIGSEASSGGILRTYSVIQGANEIIPVDVYVPGNPPSPQAIIDGFLKIKKRISSGACAAFFNGEGEY